MLSTLSTAGNALHVAVSRSLTDFVTEIKAACGRRTAARSATSVHAGRPGIVTACATAAIQQTL
jgi:hypothetical protein